MQVYYRQPTIENTQFSALKNTKIFHSFSIDRQNESPLFVRTLVSSVYKSFLTDRSKINSDQKWLFFALSVYPYFATTPFKMEGN